ncbi:PE-PPE domain-containing protein [Gordonia shandongensis]|uniref:PE-PPE domain-containing protein n=1 Tax=Gordonia shandongensis TaxID=376351 RepID=UPI000400DCB8|nr:PE-PPE domain-containing protein [Gordonia shandongensis]
MRRTAATSIAACGIALSTAAGPALAATPAAVGDLVAGSIVSAEQPAPAGTHDSLVDILGDGVRESLVVVTPGTDDTRHPRIDGLVGERESYFVNYPESFAPIISGRSGRLLPFLAPSYDASATVAKDRNLEVMRALAAADTAVVYTGYSQGSDALGAAAEQAAAAGLLGPNDTVLLVSDPRGPWGVKSRLGRVPLVGAAMSVIGVTDDGARNPKDTGDARVVHVIVQGDPVADWQWNPYRPASSLLVNAAGFLAIHSGTGPYTYARLDTLEARAPVRTLYSAEGNSEYRIYDTYHPLALLNAMIFDAVGVPVSEKTLDRWDRAADAFYPMRELTAETADPAVAVTAQPDAAHESETREDEAGDEGSDAAEPDVAEPDVAEPDAVEPDVVEPDVAEPDAVEPDAAEPDAAEPDAAEPDPMAKAVPEPAAPETAAA